MQKHSRLSIGSSETAAMLHAIGSLSDAA